MCGIASIINLDYQEANEATVGLMNAAVPHRGPNASGSHALGPVALGHTRLSIIDLDPRSTQPMQGRECRITFNGEIYNYRDVRADLIALGYSFQTESDTEVLLHALTEWGLQGLDRIDGMFAFVYVNDARREVLAARDRFGIKPLVYSRGAQSIAFASEAKQLIAAGVASNEADEVAASEFLFDGRTNRTERTFFEAIQEIRPGQACRINLAAGTIAFETWYDLDDARPTKRMTYRDSVEALRASFEASVRKHFISDVPVGLCLSGGIDSSSIVCLARALFPERELKTLSTYSVDQGFDERRFSRDVVACTGVKAIEIEVSAASLWNPDLLQEVGYFHDQPIPGGSHLNEYAVYQRAAEEGLTVMLGGQGADEYLGGYGEFWSSAQLALLKRVRLTDFVAGVLEHSRSTSMKAHNILALFLRNLVRSRGPTSKTSDRIVRAHPLLRDPVHVHGQPSDFNELAKDEVLRTSIPYQLHSEDRNSMRFSIESRVPFLDHHLVELGMSIPVDHRVRRGVRKSVLRDAVPELPASVSNRKDKMGFVAPDAEYAQHQPMSIGDAVLEAASGLGRLVDTKALADHIHAFSSGDQPFDRLFYRLVALDGWRRSFNVNLS